jgi:hypothetical protein
MSKHRVALFAVLVAIVLATVGATNAFANHASSATSAVPECQASKIKISVHSTVHGPFSYAPTAVLVTPVFFNNEGPTCHLPLGGPIGRAVRGTPDGVLTSTSEQSIPLPMPEKYGRVVVDKGGQAEVLFEVVQVAGSERHRCQPATATGFLIQDYGKPNSSERFFLRKLSEVCFDHNLGATVVNTALKWISIRSSNVAARP